MKLGGAGINWSTCGRIRESGGFQVAVHHFPAQGTVCCSNKRIDFSTVLLV